MNKLKATLGCLLLCYALHAQNGWLPPVTLPGNVCDPAGWKLVFYEEFGNGLDTTVWDSYLRGGANNNENWVGARNGGNDDATWCYVDLDKNVEVYSSRCHLITRHEPVDWHCASCQPNARRYFSTGTIQLPHRKRNGDYNYFNNGKFELRMKMPTFDKAHTTVWITHNAGVNEIDMVEGYGRGATTNSLNTYNLHAWGPNDPLNNPYNLPENAAIENQFPYQSWINDLSHTRLKIDDWHVYTCEWDTASLKFYLDNALVNTIWKYSFRFQNVFMSPRRPDGYYLQLGSGCAPPNTSWYITYGYPYNSRSECNFRITPFIDARTSNQEQYRTTTSTILGETEIDYVKIWQKHPEQEGRQDLCAYSGPIPTLTGDPEVCSNGTVFTINPVIPGGQWDRSSQLAFMSGTANTRRYYNVTNTTYANGWVRYYYAPHVDGCPDKYVELSTYCVENPHNNPRPNKLNLAVVNTKEFTGNNRFQLFDMADYPTLENGINTAPAQEWDIEVTTDPEAGTAPVIYKAYGQYVSVPGPVNGSSGSYKISWKLKTTYTDGSQGYTYGERTQASPLNLQSDSSSYFFNAEITDTLYETKVRSRIAGTMILPEKLKDTTFIANMIERIYAQELEPYLTGDWRSAVPMMGSAPVRSSLQPAATKIYPNPATDKLFIELSPEWSDNTIEIAVHDMMGREMITQTLINIHGTQPTLDVSKLAAGNYVVTLRQNNLTQQSKITKLAN